MRQWRSGGRDRSDTKIVSKYKKNLTNDFKKYEKYIFSLLKRNPVHNIDQIGMDHEDLVQECRVLLVKALRDERRYRNGRIRKKLKVASQSTYIYMYLHDEIINIGKKIHARKRMLTKDIYLTCEECGKQVKNLIDHLNQQMQIKNTLLGGLTFAQCKQSPINGMCCNLTPEEYSQKYLMSLQLMKGGRSVCYLKHIDDVMHKLSISTDPICMDDFVEKNKFKKVNIRDAIAGALEDNIKILQKHCELVDSDKEVSRLKKYIVDSQNAIHELKNNSCFILYNSHKVIKSVIQFSPLKYSYRVYR